MHGKRFGQLILGFVITAVTTQLVISQPLMTFAGGSTIPVSHISPPLSVANSAEPPVSSPREKTLAATKSATSQHSQIWNLHDADIRAVIQTISILTGRTFIIDPRVQGKVTLISQKPMTTDEMYRVFLAMLHNLQYAAVSSHGITKVVPSMNANALSRQVATKLNPGYGDEIVVRVIAINHVSATELVPVLRPLMSQSGSVTAYMPSNTLILAGTASNISRLAHIIHKMDVANSSQVTVIHLKYGDAKKIVSVIQSLQNATRSQGQVTNVAMTADEEDNTILISANMTNQLITRNLIRQLDRKGPGGDETEVIQLKYLDAKKLAPILANVAGGVSSAAPVSGSGSPTASGPGGSDIASTTTALGASTSSGGVSIQPEESNNSLIMHGPKKLLKNLRRVIRKLDVRPGEVLVEAIIVKVNQNVLNKLGIVWGTTDDNASAVPSTSSTTPGSTTGTTLIHSGNTFAGRVIRNGIIGLLPGTHLGMLIHILKTNGSSNILATPSVVVLDNKKATISDGQNLGLANRSYQGTAATTSGTGTTVTPFNTISRQDVGISLEVTPHVSPNRMIRMELDQKDDSVAAPTATASASGASDTSDNPTLNTSQIKTSVLVRSGDVLVLGGLKNNSQLKTTRKVPILGDLPLIGRLFRYDTRTVQKDTLMVFIRPIIMSGSTAKTQTMNRYNYMREQQIQMATERAKTKDVLLLPRIGSVKKYGPKLPRPVPALAKLPAPVGLSSSKKYAGMK